LPGDASPVKHPQCAILPLVPLEVAIDGDRMGVPSGEPPPTATDRRRNPPGPSSRGVREGSFHGFVGIIVASRISRPYTPPVPFDSGSRNDESLR